MRLFIAADIPEPHRVSLATALEPLKPLLPQVRWTRPESWHVTLKFLGEVPETQLDEVQEVLEDVVSRAAAFETRLTVAGAFPGVKRPRVLWMGLADEVHAFRNLAGRMERKFEKAGFPAEGRPFRPHLTLARFAHPRGRSSPKGKEPGSAETLKDWLEELSGRNIDRSFFVVRELVLFESHPGAKGSVYEPRLQLPLGTRAKA